MAGTNPDMLETVPNDIMAIPEFCPGDCVVIEESDVEDSSATVLYEGFTAAESLHIGKTLENLDAITDPKPTDLPPRKSDEQQAVENVAIQESCCEEANARTEPLGRAQTVGEPGVMGDVPDKATTKAATLGDTDLKADGNAEDFDVADYKARFGKLLL